MKNKFSLAFPLLVSAVAPTFAADNAAENTIEEILIVAAREPGNMLLDADDLNKIQASSLENIFSNQSSIAVGGGSAAAQKIYVRGFEDVMLNVTVDGAQSPGELYHHQARVQLEPEFIKTIELDAGAGAATSGAGALTGALKTTLKTAGDMLAPGQQWGFLVKTGHLFNGEDGEKYTASVYGKLSDNTGIIAAFTDSRRDEYADGRSDLAEATSSDGERGFLKLNGTFGDQNYSVTYESLQDDAISFERPNLTNFSGGFLLSDQEMSRDTLTFNYQFNPDNDLINIQANVNNNTSDFRVQRLSSDIIYGEGEVDSTGFDFNNTSIFGEHSIVFGVDYREDDLQSAQNATPPFAWGDTVQSASVTGLYAQDNWTVLDAVTVSFGLRYDDYSFKGNGGVSNGISISDTGVSPNVAVDWSLTDSFSLRAAYADAFRGVTIREAFFSGIYRHDGTLESEDADNLELGFAYETDSFFVKGTVYEQNIHNFIDAEFSFAGPGTAWGYWRNIGDAKVEGYELETGINFSNVQATLGVWDAKNTLNGAPLSDNNLGLGTSIGRTWLANLEYTGMDSFTIGANLRYVESQANTVAPGAPDKQPYAITNLYTNWSVFDKVTVSLVVNNLFDRFYYDHATYTFRQDSYVGYPAIGREIVASISYKL